MHGVRDPAVERLREPLTAFIKDISERVPPETVPLRAWTRIVRKDANTTEFPEELQLDLFALNVLASREEGTLGSVDSLLQAVTGDATLAAGILVDAGGNPITDPKSQRGWVWNHIAARFLDLYARIAGSTRFNPDALAVAFERFTAGVDFEQVEVVHLSPLVGLELEDDEVRLDERVRLRLRRLTDAELEQWLNPTWGFRGPAGPIP